MKERILKLAMIMGTVAVLAIGCGNEKNEPATETMSAQTETAAETEVTTEAQTEAATETEETETETETVKETETQMYALDDVYMREAADAKSEAISTVNRGSEVTVKGKDEEWSQVSVDGKEGYVMNKFLTDSKEEAENAVKSQQAAEEAARKAAEQAQAQSQASQSANTGKYEVSRQNYDDCDGSGHGYAVVTYSDGSTATIEY